MGLAVKADDFRNGSSPCENAKTLDRDRTSYSFTAALAAQTASPFNFEIESENIVLVAFRVFEFSQPGPEAAIMTFAGSFHMHRLIY